MDLLQRIQRWYTINCNGDWEHIYGISITNVDNPGWQVTIDLQETCLEKASLPMQPTQERSPTNWILYYVDNHEFTASGGPENLTEILSYFLDTFLPKHIDPAFTLDVHLPVRGYENRLWLKAEAKMLSESMVEIVAIADQGQAHFYEWSNDIELDLLNSLTDTLSELQIDYALGDRIEPCVFQAEDNILRTFLVASSTGR
jgi:Immunity protein 53